jgi:hypothetical protein
MNKNIFPYFDDSETGYLKNYKQILFNPGKAVQARELTGIQSLINLQNSQNFNTLYKNGSIVDGLNLSIQTVNAIVSANLTSGKFYFDGRVLVVDEQSLIISGSGTENLGLYIEEIVIKYSTDSTLVDNANGYTNYGNPGADRLKIEVKLVKVIPTVLPKVALPNTEKYDDDENVNLIWNLSDGVVQNYIRKPDYSLLSQTLAKRTFDESGHYLVEGMKLSTAKAYDTSNIKVVIEPGTCYVKGFDTTYIVPQSVDVSKSLTTELHDNEPHTYHSSTPYYELIYPYVDLVDTISVIAIVSKTITINRGSGDYDHITDAYGYTYSSIESIVAIPGYILNTDFELSNDQVHWLVNKPSGGTDYTIEFRYYKDSIRNTDFSVTLDPYSSNDIYFIRWLGVGDPDDNTVFLVNYYIYQARTDLISIDKNGYITVKSGIPTDYDETKIPSFNNEELPLGWIKFFPGKDYDSCQIYEYNFKRTTMYELHNIKQRVTDLEENLATLALEREIKEGEDNTALKGVLVDAFNTLYPANVSNTDYYISTNLVDQSLVMVSQELSYTIDRSGDTKTNIKTWTDEHGNVKYYTLNYSTKNVFFEQTLKSEVENLNPFGFIKLAPFAKLNPASDSWIDTVVKEKTIIENKMYETVTNKGQLQWVTNPTGITQLTEEKIVSIGDKASTQKVELTDKLTTYARQKTITAQGSNFEPASNLTCIAGGIYTPLTAIYPYRNQQVSGNSSGKIIVASDGSFKGTFKIPPNVKSGDIEIKFIDENKNVYTTIYKSKGVQKIIENRTTITKNFEKQIDVYDIVIPPKVDNPVVPIPSPPVVIVDPIVTPIPEPRPPMQPKDKPSKIDILKDPLAQSFIFKDDKLLVAIGLYFATKADDNAKPMVQDDYYNTSAYHPTIPATLTIGYMKNGFPDFSNALHIQQILPSEITISLYGTVETVINLTKPIYIPAMKDFYISVGSKSTEYTVYVAKLGDTDLTSGNKIMKQAYQDGSLFTSSNGITWNAEQEKDLAIKLYEGVLTSSGSIVFSNITFPYSTWTGFGRFLFMNEFTEIPNSKIIYYYSTDNGTNYKIFNPSDEIAFDYAATQLKFKMEFSTDLTGISSIMNYDTTLVFFKYDISKIGQYITKPIDPVPTYNNVKLILDENVPSNTALNKEFSADSITWFRFVQSAIDSVDIGKNFYRKTYTFDYNLLQKVTVTTVTGFAIGDEVKYVGSTPNTAKICSIVGHYVYVLLNSDEVTRFNSSHSITNGTVTSTISAVDDYESDPTWPDYFVFRLLFESSSYFRTVTVKNLRSIMKNV